MSLVRASTLTSLEMQKSMHAQDQADAHIGRRALWFEFVRYLAYVAETISHLHA